MNVYEIGHGKTGTKSLARAMRTLGFTAVHNAGRFKDRALSEIARGKCKFRCLEQYDFVGNMPVAVWRELAELRSDAKFILTVRDEEAWLDSIRRQAEGAKRSLLQSLSRRQLDYRLYMWLALFGSIEFDRERFLARYRQHNSEVRSYFAASNERRARFLEMDICGAGSRENWGKLCGFLGVDAPRAPGSDFAFCEFPCVKEGFA